ncbi:hypothetical protein PR002_g2633 [Phytophthora rubi]|uniref:Uncharacterized protein n=1 Tax=Phytophthora rubi TaxID=129364 RepID=A0A6A3NWC6_9STRA|nr:hypothetical protein PR002_g2633 [Phytophthora rubi]
MLSSSDIFFEGVDTSVAVIHGAASLYEKWNDVNKRYLKAMAKFTKSGEHDDDFFAYSWKANLTLKRGQSLSDATSKNASHRSSTKKQRSDIVKSVNALAAAIAPAEPTTVETLMS